MYVVEAEYVRSGNSSNMFGRGEYTPSHHLIRTVQDRETLRTYTPSELFQKSGQFEFLGIRRPHEIGYKLDRLHPISEEVNLFVLVDTGNDDNNNRNADNFDILVGANIDLYTLTGRACMDDMDITMRCLREQTCGKEILGAIMFSCNGRGPRVGFSPECMMDAKIFHRYFPSVPCLGFYACGEIGPIALACSRTYPDTASRTNDSNNLKNNTNVFSNHGNACVQGFTAVFALFIVPTRDPNKIEFLDDCEDTIEEFIRKRLQP